MRMAGIATVSMIAAVFAAEGVLRAEPNSALKDKTVPDGFVEMTVAGVVPIEEGAAVLLKTGESLVPIFIGTNEAIAIELRLEHKKFPRPLTHDLFDDVLRGLGGELLRVQITTVKDSTFVATVYIRQDKRVVGFDARASDSIALALGNGAPIYVARSVVQRSTERWPKPPDKHEHGPEESGPHDIGPSDRLKPDGLQTL
jgi:bifunctional DNase/RNase